MSIPRLLDSNKYLCYNQKRFVGAFYGTHNEGNVFPDLDSVKQLLSPFFEVKNWGVGGLCLKSLNQEIVIKKKLIIYYI